MNNNEVIFERIVKERLRKKQLDILDAISLFAFLLYREIYKDQCGSE